MDGQVYGDYRGQTIYQKLNEKWQIIALAFGEELPEGAILEQHLTKEQQEEIIAQAEEMRVEALSQTAKNNEKTDLLNSLSQEAATMRSSLEIQCDKDALKKSKDWYKEQSAAIEKKYK